MRALQDAGGAPLTAEGPAPDRPRRAALLLGVGAVVLALDLATKVLVVAELEGQRVVRLLGGALLLSVSRNPGAAFSLGQGATLLFTLVAITVVLVILRTAPRVRATAWAVSLGLLLGGAGGNLVDRLFRAPGLGRGAVVDFIDFRVWPVFNLADSAIVVGGALAVLLSLRGVELDRRRSSDDERAAPGPSPASGTMDM
ncbi:MAG: signal peptidase II [Actinomycetota bacterium]|nr:signal peptidase II [Actinomycetota bacterium]